MKTNRFFLTIIGITITFLSIYCMQQQKPKQNRNELKKNIYQQTPPGEIPEIFAPGIVSSAKTEFSNAMSKDGKEFFFARLGSNYSHIMVTQQHEGQWGAPFIAPFSGKFMDYDQTFSPDGKKLYFCSNRPIAGEGKKAENNHDIWVVERSKTGWSAPQHTGVQLNSKADDFFPSVANNGALYFCSSRPGGYGSSDFYRSKLVGGKYSKPKNLGPVINTKHREGDGYISPDESYFIFSAFIPGNLGSGDLYISYRNRDGTWTRPKNLGNKINSKACELTPVVSPDGKYLFFASNRTGNDDIYWVSAKFIEQIKNNI